MAAAMAPVMITATGMATTRMMTMMATLIRPPSWSNSWASSKTRLERDCFDLDQGDGRQLHHGDGRTGRAVVAHDLGVDLVHHPEVTHVPEEHRGLHHVR